MGSWSQLGRACLRSLVRASVSETQNPKPRTQNLYGGGDRLEALTLQGKIEFSREAGAFAGERVGAVRGAEFEAHLRAGHGGVGSFHEQSEVGRFDGALQPIPLRGRRA